MEEKTNVMRILEQKKIKYNSYSYASTQAISGMEVATALNQDPNCSGHTGIAFPSLTRLNILSS